MITFIVGIISFGLGFIIAVYLCKRAIGCALQNESKIENHIRIKAQKIASKLKFEE